MGNQQTKQKEMHTKRIVNIEKRCAEQSEIELKTNRESETRIKKCKHGVENKRVGNYLKLKWDSYVNAIALSECPQGFIVKFA